ncbi:interleukin-6 receptor subunit beta-like isoform X2 [Chiloscyllium punctatum]|uniref:interleukin-6 receptor subunit beta-like isoform X2 n=1 Tax=Chiloscyllium punctatum TaxID=137246 RepID=UPI003B639CDA
MFTPQNIISTWIWVLISTFIIEGELKLLCHDVDSTSKVVQLQSNISLSCALREECLQLLDVNASHIFWRMNDTQISREQYYFNATVSWVTLKRIDALRTYLTCHINIKGAPNILHRFEIEAGLPPDKPKNISCISYWRVNFTCSWDQGRETHLKTNFTLTRKRQYMKNEICPNLKKSSCSFEYPELDILGNYAIIVEAQNALGKASSDPLDLDVWHTWKTDPPWNVTVHSILGQSRSLLVTWCKPKMAPPNLPLYYDLQYQKVGTSKWIQVKEETTSNTSFVLKNLKPFTNYTVAVRCIGKDQIYWSRWSSVKSGVTSEDNPLTGPSIWRKIKNLDSEGKREVHVQWKALNRSKANGIILGYRVWYEKRRDRKIIQQFNTTSLNSSFLLTHDAYMITVIAYNSAGDSPEATLKVPAVNQMDDLPAVQDITTTSQNNQLLIHWNTSRPPDDGYVIEWCLILNASPCTGPLHWQHEPNTSKMAYLQGDLEKFKRYNISVYAVYTDGAGNPFSIPAYLQQDIPEVGPIIDAPLARETECTIKWHEIPVEKRRGFITNYTIFYKSAKGEAGVTVNSTVHEYTLKSLQKNTDYTFYVMASTVKGGMNSTLNSFTTNALGQRDIVVILVPVLVIFLLLVNMLIICFNNKHRIAKHIWPDVADPAGSSLADWFHEHQYKNDQTPKILNPGNDHYTDISTVEVLYLPEESQLQSIKKDLSSHLHTVEVECPPTVPPHHETTSNGEETKLLQQADTVVYTVLEEGYKSQIPDFCRSLSKQPLLSNTSEKSTSDHETEISALDGVEENWCPQNTDENDVFQQITKINPYLNNSLHMTESKIALDSDSSSNSLIDSSCKEGMKVQGDAGTVNVNPQSSLQDNQPNNPVQTYITVQLLGLMLNNEM